MAAVTPQSLNRLLKDHSGFVEEVAVDMTVVLASARMEKRNADVALKKVRAICQQASTCARSYCGPLSGAPPRGPHKPPHGDRWQCLHVLQLGRRARQAWAWAARGVRALHVCARAGLGAGAVALCVGVPWPRTRSARPDERCPHQRW